MLTDLPPRKLKPAAFTNSDRIRILRLPNNSVLPAITESLELAMKGGAAADVRSHLAGVFGIYLKVLLSASVRDSSARSAPASGCAKTGRANCSAIITRRRC